MIHLQNISYSHPNKDPLFDGISLNINKGDKVGLIGRNGIGKSTFLKLITKDLQPTSGTIEIRITPYYIPQLVSQYDHLTIAQSLNVAEKIAALHRILAGGGTIDDMMTLDDDWSVEERCMDALHKWGLKNLKLTQKLEGLSGGQKTRVFLSGISIHQPQMVIMDEPGNHLDLTGKRKLHTWIDQTSHTLLVVSHDRSFLDRMSTICELHKHALVIYGGNYQHYLKQKELEQEALFHDIHTKEKELRKVIVKQRQTIERQQKQVSRGKKKQVKAGVPKVMINKMKNDSENTSSRLKTTHIQKTESIGSELCELREKRTDPFKIKVGFSQSTLHEGKQLVSAQEINYSYNSIPIWRSPLSFEIRNGDRLAILGDNGSGKSTLIKLVLGHLQPDRGEVRRANFTAIYLDQDYSIIQNGVSIYDQAESYNNNSLPEHEVKTILNRFLFKSNDWKKLCASLSGGERMRLSLACLSLSSKTPDIIALDEPTNNLDIENITILTHAINEYQGTILIVSHDQVFLEQVGIKNSLDLSSP
ncbi:ribosomal protection-like ABC-F family protein [Ekhidna sp.]|uniref:ribosomal protection-like ABC-F family protein n=1 Tax=Ekhidna sp. TaxID=2608089 RepID=UPI0032EC3BF9